MANSSPAVAASDDREAKRLEELYSLGLLDTLSDLRFDRYTQLAAEIFGVPIALISLVDANRQWFKSSQGLEVTETPREVSFCTHAIEQDEEFVVEDARRDSRFRDNPLVAESPNIRFYAGFPVRGPAGYALGTCCVIDREPRRFDDRDRRILRQIGRMVEHEIGARALLVSLRDAIGDEIDTSYNRQLDMLIEGEV